MTVPRRHDRDRDCRIDGVEEEERPERDGVLHLVVPLALPERGDALLVESGDQPGERQQREPAERDKRVPHELCGVGPPASCCNAQPAENTGCKL